LVEKGQASRKDERSEKTAEKPLQEREAFEKSPTKLAKKESGKRQRKERRRSRRRRQSLLGGCRECEPYRSLQCKEDTFLR